MPVYDFRCNACGDFELIQPIASTTRTAPCPTCATSSPKILTFPAIKTAMPEHFNASLGAYVRNDGEYRDGLKEASEKASQRAGRDMSFSPVDLRDPASVGVTEEGMDATRRREVAEGKREVVKHL